jgi:hypothetical protein
MKKYAADILEKMTVGALCVGIFQDKADGAIIGSICLVTWLALRLIETKPWRR